MARLPSSSPFGPYSEYLNVTPARATWSIQALKRGGHAEIVDRQADHERVGGLSSATSVSDRARMSRCSAVRPAGGVKALPTQASSISGMPSARSRVVTVAPAPMRR
jgi:hypothetical protein